MHKFRAGYTQERRHQSARQTRKSARQRKRRQAIAAHVQSAERDALWVLAYGAQDQAERRTADQVQQGHGQQDKGQHHRSEEHTSELQSLMRNSYAVFCLKKKKEQ